MPQDGKLLLHKYFMAPGPALALAALGNTSELRALQLQWIDRKPGFQVRDGGAEAHS